MRELGVFAKDWQPGQVKTRLALTIGSERAAHLAKAMLQVTLHRVSGLAERCVLVYTPLGAWERFTEIAPRPWELRPQCEGDLGMRMREYFTNALAEGAQRVVLLGADSPLVPREYIQQAFAMLESERVVLGPSDDGGYYLVGATIVPPIFDDMPWSSAQLWQCTVDRLCSAGLAFGQLPAWYDIDELSDLQRLSEDLNQQSGPAVRQLRDGVRQALADARALRRDVGSG